MELPADFKSRMKDLLGNDFESFIKSYGRAVFKGLRVNTLKITADEFNRISPFPLRPVPWEKCGFYVTDESPGKTIFHAAGLYYVQEPSAMCAAPELDVHGGERVLDLCSAPGGKGTQLAQYMDGDGLLFLNEINLSRAKILSSNVERLGIKNAVVTCAPPEKLAACFESYFDKILVDAPCSGEGMFKKESSAVTEWSVQAVLSCARRQSVILDSAYKMLAVGGRIVYSTCTFAPEEDELQIASFLQNHACILIKSDKLYPHEIEGEGHFFAVMEKIEGERSNLQLLKSFADKKIISVYRQWESYNLKIKFENLHVFGQTLYSLPDAMPDISVMALRAGVRLGEYTGNRFEPSHSLALCLTAEQADRVEVDEATALKYLRGLTFACDESVRGWKLVTYKNYPLGWCKASDGVAKNKLPKGVRI